MWVYIVNLRQAPLESSSFYLGFGHQLQHILVKAVTILTATARLSYTPPQTYWFSFLLGRTMKHIHGKIQHHHQHLHYH